MKVIVIDEENHGLVGIAKDYPSAIDFLIAEEWLDKEFRAYPLGEDCLTYERVIDIYGDNWAEELKNLRDEDVGEFFDGSFYFREMKVFGA